MRHYSADDFLENAPLCSYKMEVEQKISLLYDLHILKRSKKINDCREEDVRKILLTCTSSTQLNNVLHGIFIGNYTLDDLLRKNEL